jgi:hypothetical protein
MSQSNFQVGGLYYFGVGFFYFYETVATRDRVGSVGCVLDIHVNKFYCKTTGTFPYHQVLKHICFRVHDPNSFGNKEGSESTCYSRNYNAGSVITVKTMSGKCFTFALQSHVCLNKHRHDVYFHYHHQNAWEIFWIIIIIIIIIPQFIITCISLELPSFNPGCYGGSISRKFSSFYVIFY